MKRLLQIMSVPVLTLLVCGGVAVGADGATDSRAGVVDAAPGGMLETLMFYTVAVMAIGGALGVCVFRSVVRMAVCLFVTLSAVSLMYFLLASNFLGAIQLIVYAGGTLILLIFGVMLTGKSPWIKLETPRIEFVAAVVVCGGLFVALCMLMHRAGWPEQAIGMPGTAIVDIGKSLMTTYLVPFEAAGVLLMIVMVGAAHLARQEK